MKPNWKETQERGRIEVVISTIVWNIRDNRALNKGHLLKVWNQDKASLRTDQ